MFVHLFRHDSFNKIVVSKYDLAFGNKIIEIQ